MSAVLSPEQLIEIPLLESAAAGKSETLVATILGSGRITPASRSSSRRLMKHFGDAGNLTRATIEELRCAGGISRRQAATLGAALDLGRSLYASPLRPGQRFLNSLDLFDRYRAQFLGAGKEYFLSLHLNSKNQLIRENLVSIGSLNTSVVHPREVFSPAVRDSTAAIILLHNHPSGDPSPSGEDQECTHRLSRAGRILGIRVLDHIILGSETYYSFADAAQLDQ